ncbi:ABC transporter ATP-binding protein [Lentilactobacillus otakiensis]|uniref:Mn/Zn ABC transporter ATPase n=1 Tax=Lentilactobacillus otakiensis DSM 19908 = JCM 15040 TaxID=1423780 RepID=S4PQU7_9LACO|nr:ABC transporter ATP-binding protein [Lentilactobacillus otakiensis]KRL11835.1 ABC transporter-like protein [Lentilactobacillus otakiensis DSM 19908 = JCM 15040]MBZ3776044.1 ABC transporter ATP-binding protein [Lentilactobacillus otakiensis]MDV3519175.1 ABC transporter ATP-binding protein [Lentilactobacillus otakiensis]GAD17520.1 mn/Zn ABC transporter ATPase [Lentilactobacillus otakiensis DSM 19908 = JCM 15040]
MSETLISVEDLSLSFPNHQVLSDLTFKVQRGEFLGVIGENGVGKTTLIRVILNQLKPSAGRIKIKNGLKIGYVPQFRNVDVEYPLSIEDFISLNFTGIKLPWLSRKEKQKIQTVIKQVNLEHISKRPLGLASGGEKQKAYLAQALINDPDLLILDESTASLDPNTKRELLDVVLRLNKALGLTIIFVSHDMQVIHEYPDHFLWLTKNGYTAGPISELHNDSKEGEYV